MTTRVILKTIMSNAWAAARRLSARTGRPARAHLAACLRDEWNWMRMIGYVTTKPRRSNMTAMQAALLAIDEMNARHRAQGLSGFFVGGANRQGYSDVCWREAYRRAA